jgi:hypothetical protein
MSGSLVVSKSIVGDVAISTKPQIVLKTNKPTVVAVGYSAVRDAIENSNISDLHRKRMVSVII